MKKYLSFFRVRFSTGLQYRMAAVTALTTQFFWGLLECIIFKVLMESNSVAMPMSYSAVVSYVWLKEAFFALFNTWAADNEIFGMIVDGGIAYEFCRPVSVYTMWFSRSVGSRMAEAALRCGPVLLGALLVPAPYKISPPSSLFAFFMFLLTMILAMGVTVSFCMIVYMLCFFTISPVGWRVLLTGAVELLSGAVIPLPFIPQPYRQVIELLPFASMQNIPLRAYSGDLTGDHLLPAVLLQVFWFVVMTTIGVLLCKRAERRIVIQGG